MGGRGGGSPGRQGDSEASPTAAMTPEQLIRDAYEQLRMPRGDSDNRWINIADLRDRLGGLSRDAQDEALRALALKPDVRIIPIANLKSLTDRERNAGLRMGGEVHHAISIKPK